MRAGKTVLTVVRAIGITCASYASYCGILIWNGNFHVVEEGQLYRSGQLSKSEFSREMDAHHIRSVLNLRGPSLVRVGMRTNLPRRVSTVRLTTM